MNELQVASQVGALDLGYSAGVDSLKADPPKLVVMLQADEGKVTRDMLGDECSIIYIGASRYDVTFKLNKMCGSVTWVLCRGYRFSWRRWCLYC